jgi:hypothetical protein
MLRAMRIPLVLAATVLALAACGKKSDAPSKLKKMDFKVDVNERGQMKVALELFDQKHTRIATAGSYTATLSRPDGTVVCTLTRPFAKTDFSEKAAFQAAFHDASCPPEPGAAELEVHLVVTTGDKPDDPKLDREVTTPIKYIYRHLAAKAPVDPKQLPAEAPLPEPPPAGSGSAPAPAGSGSPSGSAAAPAGSGSGA